MNNAYLKDIFRTIKKSRKRFLAIMIITILGVTMFSGLQAACEDLRYTADDFFDAQNLHDLQIQSTLGLTEEDLIVLKSLDLVESADGIYSETVKSHIGDQDFSFTLQTMSSEGMDLPYVKEGRLPEKADECVVTEKFLEDTGLAVGDQITIQEDGINSEDTDDPDFSYYSDLLSTNFSYYSDLHSVDSDFFDGHNLISADADPSGDSSLLSTGSDKSGDSSLLSTGSDSSDDSSLLSADSDSSDDSDLLSTGSLDSLEETSDPNFLVTTFTITGVVVDVTDVDNPSGATSYRSSQIKDLTILILPEAVSSDIYTAILLRIRDAAGLFCYGDDYESLMEDVTDTINSEIKTQREQARYDQILADANQQIDDAEAEAQEQLDDAKKQLEDGEKELSEKLADALKQLQDAQQQIEDGKLQIADGKKQLDDGEAQLNDGQAQIDAAKAEITDGWKQLQEGEAELNAQEASGKAQIEEARNLLNSMDSLTGALSGQAYQNQSEAQEITGSDFPQASYDNAVATVEGKLTPALSEAMADMDLSSLTAEQIDAITGIIKTGSADPATIAALLNGMIDESTAQELLSEIYASAQSMTPEEWEAAMSDVSETAGAIASLNTDYTNALAAKNTQLQQQIDELRAQDPQTPETEEQIAALEEQQQRLLSSSVNLAGAAVETALADSLGSVVGNAQAELSAQEASMNEQIAAARQTIEASRKQLEDGEAEIAANQKLIDSSRQTIAASRATIAEKEQELADGEKELEDGWKEYEEGKAEGESELEDGWAKYYDGLSELEKALADAREKLSEIDTATWYIQDRSSLSGYSNIGSDADTIKSLATVFPILFFVVAILICLTTITRMVEEDRGLIGTYKALGYSNGLIQEKYLVYAGAAGICGSLIGTVFAFLLLPFVVIIIFGVMYLLPYYHYRFLPGYGLCGPIVFVGGVLFATWFTCFRELNITPAILMRPKAPKGGNRVILEYIKPLWSRMSFLSKVTARNLFRYKKRLLMTIAGTAGCMALLLFGFGINDSVHDLVPNQYDDTFHYDLMAVSQSADNEKLLSYFEDNEQVSSLLNLEITSVTIRYNEESLDVQLMVFPDADSMKDYITFHNESGEILTLTDGDIYITNNASNVLGFTAGDSISMQLLDLQQANLPITSVCMNYLSNYVYLTADTFEKYYEAYEPNAVIMTLSASCTDQIAFTDEIKKKDGIVSCISTENMRNSFDSAFLLIDMVVYVIVIMSAALSFVVLFTLSTTNISERERELATLKVLGFYDNEVHRYIDKETILLTSIGIILGMPLGRAFAGTLTIILNMPNLYLAASLYPISYVYAAGLSFVFMFIVNFIMDKSLNKIDPVEALKSVE